MKTKRKPARGAANKRRRPPREARTGHSDTGREQSREIEQSRGDAARAAIPERKSRPETSREALRRVGQEVLSSNLDPEAWAQALSECRGTHDDALALYARIRTENLTRAEEYRRERVRDLETRRRGSFRDTKTVEVAPTWRPLARSCGVFGALDAVLWHFLAAAGMAGSLLAARLLWPGLFGGVGDAAVAVVVVVLQLVPLAAWWAGSGRRGIVSYPGVAQLSACVALFGSVLLAVRLLGDGGGGSDGLERGLERVFVTEADGDRDSEPPARSALQAHAAKDPPNPIAAKR